MAKQPSAEELKVWRNNKLPRYFRTLIRESTMFNDLKNLEDVAKEFSRLLSKGKLPLQIKLKSKHLKVDQITHPEDWIRAYDVSREGKNIYINRGRDPYITIGDNF